MRAVFKRSLLLLIASVAASAGENLILGTYNVRYDTSGDVRDGNSWAQRAPVVGQLIQFHKFDVLGTQEVLVHQLRDLEKLLPEYAHVGVGRDDGAEKGEYTPIFFRKDKFRALESGTFWLSATPDEVGVVGWDAALPRICTWAKLQETAEGGRTFWMFNVHFDHRGVEARVESAKLVLSKIEEMAKGAPVVLTGDFNIDQTSEGYRVLEGSEAFVDAFDAAALRYALNGTANAFNINAKTESRIDHLFVTDHFKATRYGVLTETYRAPAAVEDEGGRSGNFPDEVIIREYQARLPSDHFPVLVEVELEP